MGSVGGGVELCLRLGLWAPSALLWPVVTRFPLGGGRLLGP